MAVGIREVAEKSEVSAATVSRVLRGDNRNGFGVSQLTRERILQAAQELGYRPNLAARAVAGGKTGLVGVVVGSINASFWEDILAGIQEAAQNQDMAILLSIASHERMGKKLLEGMHARTVDGFIAGHGTLSPRIQQEIKASGTPAVWITPLATPNAAAVHVDNEHGGRIASEHLLQLGHRHIAFFGTPTSPHDAMRFKGYAEAMKKRGCAPMIWTPERDAEPMDTLTQDIERLLRENPQITGVVCSEDYKAVGVLEAAERLGRRVPRDLSVVGFDNLQWTQFLRPALTTVHQPKQEQGSAAFQLMWELMEGNSPREIWMQPELVVRHSTAPPRVLSNAPHGAI